MKSFKLVYAMLLAFVLINLTGCAASRYNTVEVQQKEVVKVTVPDFLIISCKPNPPMPVEEYVALEQTEREVYLTNYIQDLYVLLSKCDNAMIKIREFNQEN